jgi:hypothetical protein
LESYLSIIGVDVARYQPTNPDPAALTGVKFYIAKATEGTTPDPTYDAHIRHAREHDIQAVCAYHFSDDRISVKAQVDAFLKAAGNVDGYVADIEGPHKWNKAQFVEFQTRVTAATGKPVGLYASYNGYPNWGQDWNWVAYYNSTPPTNHWDIWQYGPYAPSVDGDIYRGTIEQLLTLWSGQVAQLTITDKTPVLATTGTPTTWYNLDGSVIATGHSPLVNVLSPYGAQGGFRAVYGGPGVMLVKPIAVAPVPAVNCQPLIDKAVADTKAAAHIVTVPASQTIEF